MLGKESSFIFFSFLALKGTDIFLLESQSRVRFSLLCRRLICKAKIIGTLARSGENNIT